MKAEIGTYPKDRQILYKILPLDTPLAVDIHMTHVCNFRCNYCILALPDKELAEADFGVGGLRREAMSWETFSLLMKQLKEFPRPIKMVTLSGVGEATTHPRLVDMVKVLNESGAVDKVQIISNGFLLTPQLSESLVDAGLGELRISLQGMTAEKYREIAGVRIDWDKFYDQLCYFSGVKRKCAFKVKIADIALEPGEEQKFYRLFGDICDAVAVEHIIDIWAVNAKHWDHKGLAGKKTRYGREFRELKVCRRPFTTLDVLPNGQVTQCCHVCFGHEKNIKQSSLLEQWNSKGQNELRMNMLKGLRSEYPKCRKCDYAPNTWHPEDILDGHEGEILLRMREKYGVDG